MLTPKSKNNKVTASSFDIALYKEAAVNATSTIKTFSEAAKIKRH